MKAWEVLRKVFDNFAAAPQAPARSVATPSEIDNLLKKAIPATLADAAQRERAALNYELYDLGIGIGATASAPANPAPATAFETAIDAGRDVNMLLIVSAKTDAPALPKYITDHNGFLLAMDKDGAAMRFEDEKSAKAWQSAQGDSLAAQFRATVHPDGRGTGLLAPRGLPVFAASPADTFKR